MDDARTYRLVKHALELKKPVMLLNMGPTRADTLSGIEKIDANAGAVLTDVAKATLCAFSFDDHVND